MEFSALMGSLINYEIVLKNRRSKAKPKEKNLAFKAKEAISDDEEEEEDYEEDEELVLYAKNIRRNKSLLQRRKRDMKKGIRDDYKKSSSCKKKSDDSCYKCGKLGHYAKDCRVPTFKSHYEKNNNDQALASVLESM